MELQTSLVTMSPSSMAPTVAMIQTDINNSVAFNTALFNLIDNTACNAARVVAVMTSFTNNQPLPGSVLVLHNVKIWCLQQLESVKHQ